VTDVTDEMDASAPFGILMDISLPQGNATIVAFISGDASFYTSTGGALSAESGTKKSGTPPVISSFPQRNTWIKWKQQPRILCPSRETCGSMF